MVRISWIFSPEELMLFSTHKKICHGFFQHYALLPHRRVLDNVLIRPGDSRAWDRALTGNRGGRRRP